MPPLFTYHLLPRADCERALCGSRSGLFLLMYPPPKGEAHRLCTSCVAVVMAVEARLLTALVAVEQQ